MASLENIKAGILPSHVAVIMDGNGRWAKQRGLDRVFGHQAGVEALRKVVEAASEAGIGHLTLYAFSTENWGRPDDEVAALMGLMVQSLNNETETLLRNNISLRVIGDIDRLDEGLRHKLVETIRLTSVSSGLKLIIALSYSSRWEITEAARLIARDASAGKINAGSLTPADFEKYLSTDGIPDPELLIRTSGEQRISNFLLWQLAYTELFFTSKLWPDFGKEDFYDAISDFQKRERRFGKTSEQISDK
ncbi:MAG: isoprenyl transferase [Bacteroidales bacterium]|jgi:undecaprenyl diphosphate synthase|nr:isoprenyl transferase [Bacteroidales bacterium]MCU0408512.1 isoprenyl transferase [Bacteroidales bacterium]